MLHHTGTGLSFWRIQSETVKWCSWPCTCIPELSATFPAGPFLSEITASLAVQSFPKVGDIYPWLEQRTEWDTSCRCTRREVGKAACQGSHVSSERVFDRCVSGGYSETGLRGIKVEGNSSYGVHFSSTWKRQNNLGSLLSVWDRSVEGGPRPPCPKAGEGDILALEFCPEHKVSCLFVDCRCHRPKAWDIWVEWVSRRVEKQKKLTVQFPGMFCIAW